MLVNQWVRPLCGDKAHLMHGETNAFTARSNSVSKLALQFFPFTVEVAMIRCFKLLAPVALLAVAGCATPFRAQVSRFQQMPAPQGQTFSIVADDPRLEGGLEFAQYANVVADRLSGYGYTRAVTSESANLVIRLQYDVDRGRERLRSGLGGGFGGGFGRGFGYGAGWGPYGGLGGRGWIYGFNDPFLFGGGFDAVESFTVYESQLSMKIERAGSRERVFEGTAKAMSADNDLTVLVPNLIEAMFTGFPGNSGQTVRITVAPPEKKKR